MKPSYKNGPFRPPHPWLRLALQYARFGIVGLTATAVYTIAFVFWIEAAGLAPLVANVAAFCVAVMVSFFGHFYWTFRPDRQSGVNSPSAQAGTALPKFVVVALSGFLLNSLIVFLVVNVLALPYPYAIVFMVSIVPILTFAMNRLWAFA